MKPVFWLFVLINSILLEHIKNTFSRIFQGSGYHQHGVLYCISRTNFTKPRIYVNWPMRKKAPKVKVDSKTDLLG